MRQKGGRWYPAAIPSRGTAAWPGRCRHVRLQRDALGAAGGPKELQCSFKYAVKQTIEMTGVVHSCCEQQWDFCASMKKSSLPIFAENVSWAGKV